MAAGTGGDATSANASSAGSATSAAGSGGASAGTIAATPPVGGATGTAGLPSSMRGAAGQRASAAGATAPMAGRSAGGAGSSAGASAGAGSGAAGAAGVAGATAAAGGASTSYAPCPMAEPCKILPFGDSITFGIGYAGGYRVELFHKATMDGKKITFTGSLANGPMMVDGMTFPRNNEGHSGWKIDQLLPLIPMPAFSPNPHIVLLMIGTNDIAQNDSLAQAPMRLGALLDKIVMQAPDALIVVAKLTPLRSSSAVMTYNTAIEPIVKERAMAGKHVILVDQFTGFPTSELGDGVHPNQQGYGRMAGVWYQAIKDLLH